MDRMVKLSFVVLLTVLVSFCAADGENSAFDVKNEGYPIQHDVEITWKKFMARLTKNVRITREASKRELNLLQESQPAATDSKMENEGVDDIVKAKGSRASQSCSSTTGCTATASETNTSQSSSTGTSSTSTGTSSSSSSNNASSSSSSTGGGSSSSSSGSSSSSSSSG